MFEVFFLIAKILLYVLRGESADLGNTFWKADFGKNKKMHLDRGFIKPSTEVLTHWLDE